MALSFPPDLVAGIDALLVAHIDSELFVTSDILEPSRQKEGLSS